MTNKQRPVDHVRIGPVNAAIWANEFENGVRYGVTYERLYRDPESGDWKSTASFGRDDSLVLAKVADRVHSRIHKLQAADRDKDRGDEAETAEPEPSKPRSGGAAATSQKAQRQRA